MVLLGSLPSELLSLICNFVDDPEDFISFSLLNRRISGIAKPFRKHHHEQWSKYYTLQDTPNTGYWFWHNILRSVLQGWEGAKYVRVLKANHAEDMPDWDLPTSSSDEQLVHDWDSEKHEEVLHSSRMSAQQSLQRLLRGSDDWPILARDHHQLMEDALKDMPWLTKYDLDGVKKPELHKISLVLALLVSCLPNLQKLVIARYSSSELQYLRNTVSHAGLISAEPGLQYRPLGRLKEVDFTNGQSVIMADDEESSELSCASAAPGLPGDFEPSFLVPFLAIPSIQSLKVPEVVGEIGSQTTAALPPSSTSSELAHLSLGKLNISSNVLTSILQRSTNLRTCELTTSPTSVSLSVASIVDALSATASNTLERLTIRANAVNSIHNRSISFAGFNTLVYLEITYGCLGLLESKVNDVYGLSGALPASLETLKILTYQFHQELVPNILALLNDTSSRQTKLECLFVKSWLEAEDKKAIQQACQARNIRCYGDLAIEAAGRSHGFILAPPSMHRKRLSKVPAIQ